MSLLQLAEELGNVSKAYNVMASRRTTPKASASRAC
jgi:hypothetical protein